MSSILLNVLFFPATILHDLESVKGKQSQTLITKTTVAYPAVFREEVYDRIAGNKTIKQNVVQRRVERFQFARQGMIEADTHTILN